MFRRADIRVVNESNRTIPVGPALDLRQTNVTECESGEYFEQYGRSFIVREHDARFERPVGPRNDWLARQHDEPSHVARVVLYPVREDLESVQLGGSRGGYGSRVAEVVRGYEFGRASCIVNGLASDF